MGANYSSKRWYLRKWYSYIEKQQERKREIAWWERDTKRATAWWERDEKRTTAWWERERECLCVTRPIYAVGPKLFFFSKGPKLVIWILSNVVTASTNPAEVNGGDSFNAWNRGWNLNRPISNKQSRSITTSNWVKISQQWIQVQLYEIRVLKDFFKKIK